MTVAFCGVAGDTTNVDPAPRADAYGRFEYVPIPEKCATAEATTYGDRPLRHADGVLADGLRRVRTMTGAWSDDPTVVESHAVHHDPNFERFTYGEHRPGYVARLRDLDPGDAVAFYTGLRSPDDDYMNRWLIGYFAVERVAVVDPDDPPSDRAATLAAHPHNAHAKRFRARGALHYDDRPVVVVDGTAPGGLLRRAVRLTERRDGSFRCAGARRERFFPDADGPVGLGSRKPARTSTLDADRFAAAVETAPRPIPGEPWGGER